MGSWLTEFVLMKQFSRHRQNQPQMLLLLETPNNLPEFEQKSANFLQTAQNVV